MIIYVGIAIVGVGVLPVNDGVTALGTSHINAPLVGVVEALHPAWVRDVLKYAVAIGGAAGLTAAAGASMLGVSRVGYCSPPTGRSPARSAACTRAGGRRTW